MTALTSTLNQIQPAIHCNCREEAESILCTAVRAHNVFFEAKLTFLWWKHLPGKAYNLHKLLHEQDINPPCSREPGERGEAGKGKISLHLHPRAARKH